MATQLEMECELLKVEHDIRFNENNRRAFNFRANLSTNITQKAEDIVSAIFYENRKVDARCRANHLRNLIAGCT